MAYEGAKLVTLLVLLIRNETSITLDLLVTGLLACGSDAIWQSCNYNGVCTFLSRPTPRLL
jgi:hypothetical protein